MKPHLAIVALRKQAQISQKEMAIALELPNTYLSNLEAGRKPVTLELLGKYARIFGLRTSSILLLAESMGQGQMVNIPPPDPELLAIVELINQTTRLRFMFLRMECAQ